MDTSTKLQQLFFLGDSIETDNQSEPLIPILQSSLRNSKQNEILDKLNLLINKKEIEIEKLCHMHYQEFIHSVDQLLEVKKGTLSLKENILDANSELQASGTNLLAIKAELVQHRRIQQNIETCMEILQTCLHILKLANRVNTLLNQRNYFSALKTLDELQKEHLPHINQYEFAKYMKECIPSMRDLVKQAVVLEKRDWLLHRKSGLEKMHQMLTKQATWNARENKAKVKLPAPIHLVKDELEIEEPTNKIELDYHPFYQCLHIHHKLGSFEEFQKSFEEERRQMAANLSDTSLQLFEEFQKPFEEERRQMVANLNDTPLQLGQKHLETLLIHLGEILGFFQVEKIVLYTTTGFRYPNDVESLWSLLTNKLLDEISRGLGIAEMEDTFPTIKKYLLPNIKKYLLAFIQIGEDYGYDVRKLNQFLDVLVSF